MAAQRASRVPDGTRSPFREDLFEGRVALITGGGSGIGFEIAREFGRHGAAVVLMGRREGVLEEAARRLEGGGIRCAHARGDVRRPEDAARAVAAARDRFGRLDVLVNGAAGNFLCPAEQLDAKGFRVVTDIDAVGTFTVSRAAFPSRRRSRGCILTISATLHRPAQWYQVHAAAAKAAVDATTRGLALEWGSYGVRVNGIAPGPVRGTPGMLKLAPQAERRAASTVPMGRLGAKRDIALAALFLCSADASPWVSGAVLTVDGAQQLWKPPVLPRDQVAELSRALERRRGRSTRARSKL